MIDKYTNGAFYEPSYVIARAYRDSLEVCIIWIKLKQKKH